MNNVFKQQQNKYEKKAPEMSVLYFKGGAVYLSIMLYTVVLPF